MILDENTDQWKENQTKPTKKLRKLDQRKVNPSQEATVVDEYSDGDIDEDSDPEIIETPIWIRRQAEMTQLILCQALSDEKNLGISCRLYGTKQREMTPVARERAVQWLQALTYEMRLRSDCFHCAVMCFNIVSMNKTLKRAEISLYATSCLQLATKFHMSYDITSKQIKSVSGQEFSDTLLMKTRNEILRIIKWRFGRPNPKLFQRIFHDCACNSSRTYQPSCFLLDLALMKFDFLDFRPSVIALAAFLLSSAMAGRELEVVPDLIGKALTENSFTRIIACCKKLQRYAKEVWGGEINQEKRKKELGDVNLDIDIERIVIRLQ